MISVLKIILHKRKTNKYGVDIDFFKKELLTLSQALDTITPEELHGNLIQLLSITKNEITTAHDSNRVEDQLFLKKGM